MCFISTATGDSVQVDDVIAEVETDKVGKFLQVSEMVFLVLPHCLR